MKPISQSRGQSPTQKPYDQSTQEQFRRFLSEKNNAGIYSPIDQIPGFEALVAIPFQKILIVDKSSPLLNITSERTQVLRFTPKESNLAQSKPEQDLSVRVIRICEYDNPEYEYTVPTNTILVEWDAFDKTTNASNAPFGKFMEGAFGIIASGQVENLILQDPPNNPPGRPIGEIPSLDGSVVVESDFDINPPKGTAADPTDPIVAVLDTGIKTNFNYPDGSITSQYPDSSGHMRSFKLATAPIGIPCQGYTSTGYGYAPVTDYLRASSLDPADKIYRDNTTLKNLSNLSKDQILNSPFDDHLVHRDTENLGRHGTTIAAIITQKSEAAILPVKVFNNGGQGTLFDLLCGLNYVLACHKAKLPIQVINLSFVGQFHYDAYQLLLSKFKALRKAGIWAVAAAGNRLATNDMSSRRELKRNVADKNFDPSPSSKTGEAWNLFPACFANDLDLSVFTVTTVQKVPDLNPEQPKPSNFLTWIWSLILALLRLIFSLFGSPKQPVDTTIYEAVNNYGNSFVSVGVIEPLTKVFQNASPDLNATSFAVPFFAAKLADYLKKHPQADRNQILQALAMSGKMKSNNEIADNWLLHYQ